MDLMRAISGIDDWGPRQGFPIDKDPVKLNFKDPLWRSIEGREEGPKATFGIGEFGPPKDCDKVFGNH